MRLKKFFEWIFDLESKIAKKWAASSHKRLFFSQWYLQPSPEWMDHSVDQYYQWSKSRESFWVERGVYNNLALQGGNTLELSCGDGFNAKHFYSSQSKKVVACDFDEAAIRMAKKKNYAPNVEFILADIRTDMPTGKYANIIWDAAIEHFTEKEIEAILENIKSRLNSDGIVSGYTIVERPDGVKSLHQHEYEFKSMSDLKRFFDPHFKNVKVFETLYKSRHNLYFWASDGLLPFDDKWPHSL